MIKSMTGYGRAEASAGSFRAAVEIRSVNHRFADLKIKVPAELTGLEPPLHERLQKTVHRGRLDVSVSVAQGASEGTPLEINRPLVASYVRAADQLRQEFGLDGGITLEGILSLPDVVKARPAALALAREHRTALMEAFEGALNDFETMRRREGDILARDITRRLGGIGRLHDRIARRAPKMVPLYARRLRARIRELDAVGPGGVDKGRLAQEVALIAERSDITEELVRLAGYLEQLRGLMADAAEPVGKKLDFIMQEMNREANTIGSKAIDLAICQDALELKAEVEKIREQVQNIE